MLTEIAKNYNILQYQKEFVILSLFIFLNIVYYFPSLHR